MQKDNDYLKAIVAHLESLDTDLLLDKYEPSNTRRSFFKTGCLLSMLFWALVLVLSIALLYFANV